MSSNNLVDVSTVPSAPTGTSVFVPCCKEELLEDVVHVRVELFHVVHQVPEDFPVYRGEVRKVVSFLGSAFHPVDPRDRVGGAPWRLSWRPTKTGRRELESRMPHKTLPRLIPLDDLDITQEDRDKLRASHPDGIRCGDLTWKSSGMTLAKTALAVGTIAGPAGFLRLSIASSALIFALGFATLFLCIGLLCMEKSGPTSILPKRPVRSAVDVLVILALGGSMAWCGGWGFLGTALLFLGEAMGDVAAAVSRQATINAIIMEAEPKKEGEDE